MAAAALLVPMLWLASRPADVAALEATLAAQDSATAALGQWCAARGLAEPEINRAEPATIRAEPVRGEAHKPPHDVHRRLAIATGEPIGYRHVRLSCGGKVLSEAHNWYVPARLSPAMNATLAQSDTPFGRVAAPLGYRRERLESRRGASADCPPGTILSHRAMLRLPDGRPLSLLVECYTAANLAPATR